MFSTPLISPASVDIHIGDFALKLSVVKYPSYPPEPYRIPHRDLERAAGFAFSDDLGGKVQPVPLLA